MTRRAALALALAVGAACERQPLGPRPVDVEPSFATQAAEDNGPPPPRRFGRDSRETGVNTGQGTQPEGLTCVSDPSGKRTCSGYLASYVDGTLLDVLVEVPSAETRRPLVVFLHGWAGSKTGSGDIVEKLLEDGHAVLRYTARGFGNSFGKVNLADVGVEVAPFAPPGCDGSAASRPPGDLQSMIAEVVDYRDPISGADLNLDPDAVAVTGVSYGGGQTWLAALQPHFPTRGGNCVRIRALVPIVPWTDLLYSLVPNGETRRSFDPPGALKLSYVNALYASGCREPTPGSPAPCDNYPQYLKVWHAWLNGVEPSRPDPVFRRIANGLAGHRSIWWQQDFWRTIVTSHPVPVFEVQGSTDDLFTFEEARRMLLAVKAVNPSYPISVYFGDIGHPRALNKPAEMSYVIDDLLRPWLRAYLIDGAQPNQQIYAAITRPRTLAFDPQTDVITLSSYDALATESRTYPFTEPRAIVNPGSGAPTSAAWDPLLEVGANSLILTGELRPGSALPVVRQYVPDPTIATYDIPVSDDILVAGQPMVTVRGHAAALRLQLDVRLLDVHPDGSVDLITRGTHTLESRSAIPIGAFDVAIRTDGNVIGVASGHTIRVQIFNVDNPRLRPSIVPSVTQISNVEVAIPVRPPSN